MKRLRLETLIVTDTDIDCRGRNLTLEDLGLGDLNFILQDLEKFDLIVYQGKRGTKILRNKYF